MANLREHFKEIKWNDINVRLNRTNIFITMMLICFILSALVLKMSRGGVWLTLVHHDINDIFMDFFNSIYYEYVRDPYTLNQSIYPAFPNLIYHFLSRFIPFDVFVSGPFAIRDSVSGMNVFALYNVATITPLSIMLFSFVRGSGLKKITLTLLVLFSAPFVFQYQRANIILIAFIFLLAFIKLKESDKWYLRELSYVMLACASVIKIYPAIFYLVLLREKKFIEFGRATIYGLALFITPFIYMGGLGNIVLMLKNIGNMSNLSTDWGFAFKVSFINTIAFMQVYVTNSIDIPAGFTDLMNYGLVLKALGGLLILGGLVTYFMLKDEWKAILLLSVLMIGIPGFSYNYSMIFMAIPLIMFLNDRSSGRHSNRTYTILFVLSMAPFMFIPIYRWDAIGQTAYGYNITTLFQSISLIVFLLLLNFEGLKLLLQRNSSNLLVENGVNYNED